MVVRALNNHNDRKTILFITIYILVVYAGRKLAHNFIKMSNKFTTFIFFFVTLSQNYKKNLKYGRE